MCGRFTFFSKIEAIKRLLKIDSLNIPDDDDLFGPRYNIAPSQEILAARVNSETGERVLTPLRWGLIPFWAKDKSIGNKTINARGEEVFSKPAFRAAAKKRRCLIPADGFYEWKKAAGGKQPFLIKMKNNQPFAFAGLWEQWEGEGETIESCTILTTQANELVSQLHHRMPVILSEKDYTEWLDPNNQDKDKLAKLILPFPSDDLSMHPVSNLVNSPRNDNPRLIEKIESNESPSLFDE